MVLYPILFRTLGLSDQQSGFLVGATIHDVAQVVGAGFSISDRAGDLATLVKLGRVVLLPVVLLVIVLSTGGTRQGRIGIPGFVAAFIGFVALNNIGVVPDIARDAATLASQWLLIIAISALGVRTSLKAMLDLGPKYVALIVAETAFLLVALAVVLSSSVLPRPDEHPSATGPG